MNVGCNLYKHCLHIVTCTCTGKPKIPQQNCWRAPQKVQTVRKIAALHEIYIYSDTTHHAHYKLAKFFSSKSELQFSPPHNQPSPLSSPIRVGIESCLTKFYWVMLSNSFNMSIVYVANSSIVILQWDCSYRWGKWILGSKRRAYIVHMATRGLSLDWTMLMCIVSSCQSRQDAWLDNVHVYSV